MWNSTAFSEKRSESRSTRSMQKYQYFEWGSTLHLDGFQIIIFQYIICEPFRSRKEGLVKLNVNLCEIWRKFKCRRSTSGPLPWKTKILHLAPPMYLMWTTTNIGCWSGRVLCRIYPVFKFRITLASIVLDIKCEYNLWLIQWFIGAP